MRKCVRCGAEMEEGFTFTGSGGNVIRRKGLGGKAVYPKAAVCPNCGAVIYASTRDMSVTCPNRKCMSTFNVRKGRLIACSL